MKFRAVITDTLCMRELLDIVTTFSRINRNIAINIQPSKVIIQIEGEVEAGQCLWCEIDASNRNGFFSEFVMDGVDAEHNQIYLMAATSNLVQALSYTRNNTMDYVKMKLVKTDVACLEVEMSGIVHNESDIMNPKVQHQIPVTVVPRSEWGNFDLPLDMVYDLTVMLPSVKSLKGLMDKKKNMSPSVTIYATLAGELSLVVETDVVTVASHFKGLQCARAKPPDGGETEPEQETLEAACKVDAKKLSTLLESVDFCETKMIANIKNEHLLKIKFEMREHVFMNFILPAVDFE
ncbi:checkpoint protein HUS1 [Ochlerotatus camptorhynchus]|uniref:checkpoint protein HUS1 n=1 Tax=Ochlerotatus camptorhynchus TaxID=644619 RepID=UPI0031D716BB